MFTGIIETMGVVKRREQDGGNLQLFLSSHISAELKIDQSLSHNGVCLTVVGITDDVYQVTAVEETLAKSNLNELQAGDRVNLERAMVMGARLDGHMVQGHVDQTAVCVGVEEKDGSWEFAFEYDPGPKNITVEKGSICVDGVSLTVVNSGVGRFSVAIIPYTYEHTRFGDYKVGTVVNLEFDIVGKYVARLLELRD